MNQTNAVLQSSYRSNDGLATFLRFSWQGYSLKAVQNVKYFFPVWLSEPTIGFGGVIFMFYIL